LFTVTRRKSQRSWRHLPLAGEDWGAPVKLRLIFYLMYCFALVHSIVHPYNLVSANLYCLCSPLCVEVETYSRSWIMETTTILLLIFLTKRQPGMLFIN
jgi:hypothetical protein